MSDTVTGAPVEPAPLVAPDVVPDIVGPVGFVFTIGMVLACCHLLVAALLLRRMLRRAVPAPASVTDLLAASRQRSPGSLRILISDVAWRPFCCGLLRPRIVLPRALFDLESPARDARLLAVLLHELAHLSRGDMRGRLLFAFAMPLQFWNPCFWTLRRRARDAAELLADEVAAGRHEARASYARSLIDLAEWLPAAREGRVVALGVFGPEVRFSERMTMLLQRRVPLTTRCSRVQTALRSTAAVSLAVVAAACWTGPVVGTIAETKTVAAVVDADQGPRTFFAYDDTEVTQVIDTIARIGRANIVVGPDVTGRVTLHVRGVPWRGALEAAVAQVGAHVVEADRGILRVIRSPATAQLRVDARALEVKNTTPRQVHLDVRVAEGDAITQMPQVIVIEGQQANMFVGDADASGAETGLVVAVDVAGPNATLDVSKRDQGRVVCSQRLTIPVQR